MEAFLEVFLDFGFSSSESLPLSEESFLADFLDFGFSLSSESLSEEESFLAAAFLAGAFFAGFSSDEESSEESEESSLAAAFLAGAFLAGFSLSDEESSEEESFLAAAFLAGAFLAGFSLSDEESEDESFLAAFLAGAAFFPLTTSTADESESLSEEELSSTLDFLTGTAAFSAVFLDLLLEALLFPLLALTLDSALALLAATLVTGLSELSEESLEDEAFLAFFLSTLTTFLSSAFLFLFLVSSIDCFLDGASDDEADTTFFYSKNKYEKTLLKKLFLVGMLVQTSKEDK